MKVPVQHVLGCRVHPCVGIILQGVHPLDELGRESKPAYQCIIGGSAGRMRGGRAVGTTTVAPVRRAMGCVGDIGNVVTKAALLPIELHRTCVVCDLCLTMIRSIADWNFESVVLSWVLSSCACPQQR